MEPDELLELHSGESCPKAQEWAHELFADNAAYVLNRASTAARVAFGDGLLTVSLTARQMAVMEILAHREPLKQQEIGLVLSIDRTSMVALIDEMERLDLVVRECDPTDRRAHALRLTPAGVAKLEEAREVIERAQTALLEPLGPGEWDILRSLLLKLLQT